MMKRCMYFGTYKQLKVCWEVIFEALWVCANEKQQKNWQIFLQLFLQLWWRPYRGFFVERFLYLHIDVSLYF